MSRSKFKRWLEKAVTLGGHANARTTQFLRYTVTASSSFALDLILLWTFTELFGIYYLVSAGLAFGIAISVNYVTCRAYAFSGSLRKPIDGYLRFIGIALAGIMIVLLSMRTLVETFGIPYLLARVTVGIFVGFWNYTMNAFWNFRR
jgi:putative flippase GtrA